MNAAAPAVELCVICSRRPPHQGAVCDADRTRLRLTLTALAGRLARLPVELMPGPGAAGEKVRTSRVGSPPGARLDVLTLTGPGADGLSPQSVAGMLHPHVRRWQETRTAIVVVRNRAEVRKITEWFSELVRDADGHPVQVAADDQVGLLPPVEWLDSWVRTWREHFGHSTAVRTRHVADRPTPAQLRDVLVRAAADANTSPAVAWMATVVRTWRRHAANTVLGMNGYVPPGQRPHDPLAHEWEIRWGRRGGPAGTAAASLKYLTTWLDQACDADVGIADFATELRSLSAELARVLGDTPDQQWIGRCPAILCAPDDPDNGRRCGAGLWQDPYSGEYLNGAYTGDATVTCPRCRSTWGPKRLDLHRLAVEIRRTWPLDRRRRYSADERANLPDVKCPRCTARVRIGWKDVTGRYERTKWWVISGVTCPNRCDDARTMI